MQVILKIAGMHCTGCQNRLQNSLSQIKNLKNLEVSLNDKNAKFTIKQESDIDEVINRIESLGFQITDIQKDSD